VRRWFPVAITGAILAAAVGFGISGNSGGSTTPGTDTSVDGTTVPTGTQGPIVTGSVDPSKATHLNRILRWGMQGDDIKLVQQRLKDLRFDPGPVDGKFGTGTQMAIWAFQGLVQGLNNLAQSDTVDDKLWQAMQADVEVLPRRADKAGERHLEIYLPVQAAVLFDNNVPVLLTHISSGSNEKWCDWVKRDTDDHGMPVSPPIVRYECGRSKTPGGVFTFYRRSLGTRYGPLGGMYNPVYFNYSIAVHGANKVPKKPASHGCVRIPEWIANYFPTMVKNGDKVYVWNGKKEPEAITEAESRPVFNRVDPHPPSTIPTSTT
jgi:hypothetical protein